MSPDSWPAIMPLGSAFLPPSGQGFHRFDYSTTLAGLLQKNDVPPLEEAEENEEPRVFQPSETAPRLDIEELRRRPVPTLRTLLETRHALEQVDPSVYVSFLDDRTEPSIPTPLWMIDYWLDQWGVADLREDCQRAAAWLANGGQTQDGRREQAVADVLETFGRLRCEEMLVGEEGTAGVVLSILGGDYMVGNEVDAMVEAVHLRLQRDPVLAGRFEVYNHWAYMQILLEGSNPGARRPPASPVEERGVAVDGARARMTNPASALEMVFLMWLTDNPMRWVVIGLEVRTKKIRMGDGLGRGATVDDVDKIQGWLQAGGLGGWSLGEPLRVGGPPEIKWCAVLAINAIEHAIFEEELATAQNIDVVAMEEYLAVVESKER
ncbi:hypothetical protein C8Q76DRAFT_801487 [Earliella scabrosa]|nr:hypothetical protein C8Q76DRAFT_801487 [Earliella scabrosa]